MGQESVVVYAHQAPIVEAASRRPGRTNKTQLKLYEAAMDLMYEGGLVATTVEGIAERAGVSKGTVYYNFGSKKTMVDQLLQYGAKLLLAEMTVASQGVQDPRLALRQALEAAIIYLDYRPGFARLWVTELWQAGAQWSVTTDLIRADIMRFICQGLEEVKKQYRVDEARPIDGLAVIIFGSVFMLSMDKTRHGCARSAQEAADLVMLTLDSYILGPGEGAES